MTPIFQLTKSLNKAIRDLKKHGLMDSPVFHIKSKKQGVPRIVYKPSYDEGMTGNREDVTSKIKQICDDVDAKEVLTVSNVHVHVTESSLPSDAVYISLERGSKIYSVLQLYSFNGLGKIKFHKNREWQTKDKKGPLGDFECFVK
jgi:hypothetical protein